MKQLDYMIGLFYRKNICVQGAQSVSMVRMVKNGERSYIERSWAMRGLILKRGSWGEAGEAWGTEGHIEIGSWMESLHWRRVFNQKSKCQTMDSDQTWLCRPLFKQCSDVCFVAIQSVRFSFWEIFQNYFTLFTFCKFCFYYTFMSSIFTFCKMTLCGFKVSWTFLPRLPFLQVLFS